MRARFQLPLILAIALCGLTAVPPRVTAQDLASAVLTLNVPEPTTFELALDEIELDWSQRDPKRLLSRGVNPIAGTQVAAVEPTRVLFSMPATAGATALAALGAALEAANPGAEANLILYEPGGRRPSGRRSLTRRVALLLEQPGDPTGALAEYAARSPRGVPNVPGGYVLEASDPLSAIELADALRLRAGVVVAYPLLTRQAVPR
jgi:hypothetical protein